MNKLVKGSIAGAAGIALLLGGAGTLAYWNDSATFGAAGTITAGQLSISNTVPGEWSDDIALIVPGDNLEYTEAFTITATGDNLTFDLDTNIDTLVAASTFTSATVVEEFVVTDGLGATVSSFDDLGPDTYTVVVSVVVDFPIDAANGNKVDQLKSLDLSAAEVTVTQNH